jgi:hypothetical protein
MSIPYTLSDMPKTAAEKRLTANFQFKLFDDEVERWKGIVKAAKLRALERDEDISETDINRALVGLAGAKKGIVTEVERRAFLGHQGGYSSRSGRANIKGKGRADAQDSEGTNDG